MRCESREEFEKDNVFGTGEPNAAFARHFTGESFLNPLTNAENGEFPLFNVTFEPGCRNAWHIHRADEGGGRTARADGSHDAMPFRSVDGETAPPRPTENPESKAGAHSTDGSSAPRPGCALCSPRPTSTWRRARA